MSDRAAGYEALQQRNFGELVQAGRYGADFHHKPRAAAFVRDCLDNAIPATPNSGLRILDCGCGPGAWLEFIMEELQGKVDAAPRYYGFDLTAEMVDVARRRLPNLPPAQLQRGNVLDAESYAFDDEEPIFDVVFCYDVIQQLPPRLQFQACETMVERLRAGGVALIFDQERNSLFGLVMGFLKFLRRYLGVPLVPMHYTAARYPPMKRLARKLRSLGYETTIKIAPNRRKRVLTARRLPGAQGASSPGKGTLEVLLAGKGDLGARLEKRAGR